MVVIVGHVQRLVHVAHEVQHIFEREDSLGGGSRRIAQLVGERLGAVNDARLGGPVLAGAMDAGWP